MSVAKHTVKLSDNPKTLNYDRKKYVAEKIDIDNLKIIEKITTVYFIFNYFSPFL